MHCIQGWLRTVYTSRRHHFKPSLNALHSQKLTWPVDKPLQCVLEFALPNHLLHWYWRWTHPYWEWSPLGRLHSTWQMVPFRVDITRQPGGAQSSQKCIFSLFTTNQRQTDRHKIMTDDITYMFYINSQGHDHPPCALMQWNYGIGAFTTGSISWLLINQDFKTPWQTHSAGSSHKNTSGK